MTPPRVGNFGGRYAERRVYVDHRQQTIDFERKWEIVRRFFEPATSHDQRRSIMIASGCGHVAADGERAAALMGWGDIEEVFASAEMTIYRFSPAEGP